MKIAVCVGAMALAFSGIANSQVVISEIMYHPSSNRVQDEFVEITNTGAIPVDLTGWRLSGGIDFAFPALLTLPAQSQLVIAADLTAFQATYPGITNVVGAYTGRLSDSIDTVNLRDLNDDLVDHVTYADEGDWAQRQLGPLDNGYQGWEWITQHDGGGPSAERRSLTMEADTGQNWGEGPAGGTPGAPNSIATNNVAPLILDVTHLPAVPPPGQAVFINARVLDESASGVIFLVYFRDDGAGAFSSLPMLDNGLNNDGAPGDGLFGATLPGRPQGSVVEFYLEATDVDGRKRVWPAPSLPGPTQNVNLLYQVDATPYSGPDAEFRLIMTEAERAKLDALGTSNPGARSNAQMNGTFISRTPQGVDVRYQVGIRNRGKGSRTADPNNHRVNFPHDAPWKGYKAINLNARYTHSQIAAGWLTPYAGLVAGRAQPAQVRVNNANLAKTASPMYGAYVWLDVLNSDWIDQRFPESFNGGNLYTGSRNVLPGANLEYLGTNTNNYRVNYAKKTNEAEDDWSDLIALTYALSPATSDAAYSNTVSQIVDIDNWLRYFAFLNLIGYQETSLATADGDDYRLVSGTVDPRFRLVPHDNDTCFGEGDTPSPVAIDLFVAAGLDIPGRFLKHPDIAPQFYAVYLEYLNGFFEKEAIDDHLNSALEAFVPQAKIDQMVSWCRARHDATRSVIPENLSIVPALPLQNGYRWSTAAQANFSGKSHAVQTRSVRVNGVTATWTAWTASWTLNNLPLHPGLNEIFVEALDASGQVFETAQTSVWYEDASTVALSTTIASDLTLTAAGGPYTASGTVTVAPGAVLTLEPGATVIFGQGARLVIQGGIQALGTKTHRISLIHTPGTAETWNGVDITNSAFTNVIQYVDFVNDNTGSHALQVNNSALFISYCTFVGSDHTVIDLVNASAYIHNNIFPTVADSETIHGSGLPTDGFMIIESNVFGTTTGYSDVIDFTGGQRPGAILQLLSNVFLGGSDDGIDADGTDAHIEGNVFMNFSKQNTSDSSSNAIATGKNGADASEITVVRNVFINCEHAVLLKEGSSMISQNNTYVGSSIAAVQFDEPNRPVEPALGASFEADIFWNNEADLTNYYVNDPVEGTTLLSMNACIVDNVFTNLGSANFQADPRLVDVNSDAHLMPGSPAAGTGPLGLDRGAYIPAGIHMGPVPPPVTVATNFVFETYGAGQTHFLWRLNGGAWSSSTPVGDTIILNDLVDGAYTLEARGINSAGVTQAVARVIAWEVDTSFTDIRIHEFLADNQSAHGANGIFPDYIEIKNHGAAVVDLADYSLSDSLGNPRAFVFPSNTLVQAGATLLVYADGLTNAPGLHASFSLDADGEKLGLYAPLASGGGQIDFIDFGLQIPDFSLGRNQEGEWTLQAPTPLAENLPVALGDVFGIRINEWLANQGAAYEDFIELYNPSFAPVDIGQVLVTDEPVGWPNRDRIPAYSYILPRGYQVLTADGNAGARHVNFTLSAVRGEIAILDVQTNLIDLVSYGPQSEDISEGRSPDGSNHIIPFNPPSPGSMNREASAVATEVIQSNPLSYTGVWKYFQTGAAPAGWEQPGFDDSAWPEGPGLLYVESSVLSAPKSTPLTLGQTAYYFRHELVLNELPEAGSTVLYTYADDGFILYLNGVELHRLRMPAGAVSHGTLALTPSVGEAQEEGPFVIPFDSLNIGTNVIACEVHQATVGSSDIVWGARLELTYTNLLSNPVFSEIMASGSEPDWVEVLNPGSAPAILSGMGITDDPLDPYRWTFPPGTQLAGGERLVIHLNPLEVASATNAPFGLDPEGERLHLFAAPENGGSEIDALLFGLQASGFSLGRIPDAFGPWELCQPTPGATNLVTALGNPFDLYVNEWMSGPTVGDDWVEIYNASTHPVALGGLYLTDALGDRNKSVIAPLSFIGIGSNAWRVFQADGNPQAGANHADFKLSSSGEQLGIFTGDGIQIEALVFSAQNPDESSGRIPDGGATILPFPGSPTPGSANIAADNDFDGMPDGWELLYGLNFTTNDAAADPDMDDLSNLEEYLRGTLPGINDTDGDGTPDGWEHAYGLNPLNFDATLDSDFDGLSNGDEFILGTRPDVGGDTGLLLEIELLPNGTWLHLPTILATGTGYVGRTRLYGVERSQSAPPWSWEDVPGLIDLPATGALLDIQPNDPATNLIYRARVHLESAP